ncbi:MAG: UDP-glucose--hexose-1-phosphate uridylyltransferase [Anaerolineae bacterium]|nr:MAG: UDP-glucose--hexose-1-phosphate uridylyltransferase [Anaerolineae bacterium]
MIDLTERPHRRYNPLTNEWILVSPHRAKRPWQGQVETIPEEVRPEYDPTCYLCPGNPRAGGNQNPPYEETFVFNNDFPSLLPDTEPGVDDTNPLFQSQAERGICRVICFSPRHDWTLAHMPVLDIQRVVDAWARETQELAANAPWMHYVQVFENKGEMMGCSNPHPHGQIWATERLPREVEKEEAPQRSYFEKYGRTMVADILAEEQKRQERIVYANEHWTILIPFWAVWPFETLMICHRPVQWLYQLNETERRALADAVSALTIRYDNLFKISFPYSMGFHQAPVNSGDQPHWHLHAHYYPPLLRSATVRKHMVGYEMLGTPQRDITAEIAAARLRELPGVRFA